MSEYILSTYNKEGFDAYLGKIKNLLENKRKEFIELEQEEQSSEDLVKNYITQFEKSLASFLNILVKIEKNLDIDKYTKIIFFTEVEEDLKDLTSFEGFFNLVSIDSLNDLLEFSESMSDTINVELIEKQKENIKKEEQKIHEEKLKKEIIQHITKFLQLDIDFKFVSEVHKELELLREIPDKEKDKIQKKLDYIFYLIKNKLIEAADYYIEQGKEILKEKPDIDEFTKTEFEETFEFLKKAAENNDIKNFDVNLKILRSLVKDLSLKLTSSDGILSKAFVNLFPQFDLSGGLWEIDKDKIIRKQNKQLCPSNGKVYWVGANFNNPVEALLLSSNRFSSLIRTKDNREFFVPNFELMLPADFEKYYKNKEIDYARLF